MQQHTRLSSGSTHYRVYAPTSLLGKVVATVLGGVAVVTALVFSLVFVAIVLVGGLVLGGYLWWRTRDLRKRVREQQELRAQAGFPPPEPQGRIIEGEAVREPEGAPDLGRG